MIKLTNLSKTYRNNGKEIKALQNINLHVQKGEIFGVIGYSGAGKSSLIRCVNMLEVPDSGSVCVNGVEMTQLKGHQLREARRKIGMIFQHFNLLQSANVLENVAVPLQLSGVKKQEAEKKVKHLLEVVGLSEKADSYPHQLSGGQKQRVAIARALANDIDILLCDEATSALDPQTTDSILELLLDINRKFAITILLITHEMHVIKKICDRVAVLEQGKIIEENSVINLFTNPQTETTRLFIKNIIDDDLPQSIWEKLRQEKREPGVVLRLTFVGCTTAQPMLAQLAKEYPLWPNILYGNITQVKDHTLGRLIVELQGDTSYIQKGIQFLREKGVKTEVLDHGR